MTAISSNLRIKLLLLFFSKYAKNPALSFFKKGRCINAKQGRYAINGFKKLDSYKEER